jgi:simple sugar transport system permease protein
LIIVCTVLVQEQNLGQFVARWRHKAPPLAPRQARSAEIGRLRSAQILTAAREDFDEAS